METRRVLILTEEPSEESPLEVHYLCGVKDGEVRIRGPFVEVLGVIPLVTDKGP